MVKLIFILFYNYFPFNVYQFIIRINFLTLLKIVNYNNNLNKFNVKQIAKIYFNYTQIEILKSF